MKINNIPAENNSLNNIVPGRSSVIKETLSRPAEIKQIKNTLTSNDVNISERALIYSKISAVIKHLPEVREDKVESVSRDMRSGEYRVSAEQVASGIFREHIINALSGE